MEVNKDIRDALRCAADALSIADDWNLPEVQVDPPVRWGLPACGSNAMDGWCGTLALSDKMREILESLDA